MIGNGSRPGLPTPYDKTYEQPYEQPYDKEHEMAFGELSDVMASVAAVTEQLVREFGAALSPRLIARTVTSASNRLTAESGRAGFAEALADLARSRLSALRLELSG